MKKTIIVVVILSVFGKAFGLLRDILITYYFGFGELTDALYISIAVVGLLYSVFNTVIRSSFSPMFSTMYIQQREETLYKLNSIGNFIILILALITVTSYLFPSFFLQIISPGVSENTKLYAIEFLKPLSLVIFLYGIVSLLNGFLQAVKVYKTSEIAVLINNVSIIFVFVSLYNYLDYISIVYSYVFGAFIQFIFVLFIFKRQIHKFQWNFKLLKKEPIREFSVISKYLLLSAFVAQFTVIADKFVASFLDVGAITALQYASTIKNLPITIVIMVVTNVLFTNLSISHSTSLEKFQSNVIKQIDLLLAFITPIIIFIIFHNKDIVRFLFLRGEFDENGVLMTASALLAYSFGLFFVIIKEVLNKAALAAKETRVTFTIAVFSLFFNLILNVLFSYFYGHIGIALSTSISALLNSVLLIFILKKKKVIKSIQLIKKIIFKHIGIFIVSLIFFYFYRFYITEIIVLNLVANLCFIFLFNMIIYYSLRWLKRNG